MLNRNSNKMSAGHSGGGTVAHHVLPLKLYFGIFAILLFLTVVTVAVSVLALPEPWAIIVAMLVASVKALLVALFFMHLKYDDRFYWVITAVSVLFLFLFFSITLADLSTRGYVIEEQENDYMKKYDPSAVAVPPVKGVDPAPPSAVPATEPAPGGAAPTGGETK